MHPGWPRRAVGHNIAPTRARHVGAAEICNVTRRRTGYLKVGGSQHIRRVYPNHANFK